MNFPKIFIFFFTDQNSFYVSRTRDNYKIKLFGRSKPFNLEFRWKVSTWFFKL